MADCKKPPTPFPLPYQTTWWTRRPSVPGWRRSSRPIRTSSRTSPATRSMSWWSTTASSWCICVSMLLFLSWLIWLHLVLQLLYSPECDLIILMSVAIGTLSEPVLLVRLNEDDNLHFSTIFKYFLSGRSLRLVFLRSFNSLSRRSLVPKTDEFRD